MSVFRSNKQIYVHIIDDLSGKTLAAASSLGMTEKMPKKEQAKFPDAKFCIHKDHSLLNKALYRSVEV